MKKSVLWFVVAGIFLISAGAAVAEEEEVAENRINISTKEGIGKYFTDRDGRTLYWYKQDTPGKSACSGPCLKRAYLYYYDTIVPPEGIESKEFGTITRSDGKKQTTFRGFPLYYNRNDLEPGDVNRQIGDNVMWLVINPDAFPPKGKKRK